MRGFLSGIGWLVLCRRALVRGAHGVRPDRMADRMLLMTSIRLLLPVAGLLATLQPVWADEQAACTANMGHLLSGTLVSGPRFAHGHEQRGVELSHTHVRLRGEDGRFYDIAIDDVFAPGYDQAGEHVPVPLSQIKPGDRLELCGK